MGLTQVCMDLIYDIISCVVVRRICTGFMLYKLVVVLISVSTDAEEVRIGVPYVLYASCVRGCKLLHG